jgi:radical SAM superfamily enzyme YgiQ (UPF0313 family)
MYLSQYLRLSNSEYIVKILDSMIYKLSYKDIAKYAKEFSPDFIGITSYTYLFYDVWMTARELKKELPGVPIAVGGPHMYLFAKETLSHSCFDYGISGDGEEIFSELCDMFFHHKEIKLLPGLFFRRNNEVAGRGSALVKDLDSVVYPAIDLIDPALYYNPVGKGKAVGTICSSRGCPFRCTFCQVPHRLYRARSVKNIAEEIRIYMSKGITDFFFFDDLFNLTVDRVTEFCEYILANNLKISWMFRGRIDQLNAAMLKLARKAGCHTISVGIEDATDDGLRAIKKNITIKDAFRAVRLISKSGIRCSTNWIIGLPHHRSLKDLEHLLDIAIKMDSDYAQFSILQCLPGSELYVQATNEGGIDPSSWREYILNPVKNFSPPVWEKYLTKKDMFSFYEHAYLKYYFRPKFILRELLRIRNLNQFSHKLRAFRSILLNRQSR